MQQLKQAFESKWILVFTFLAVFVLTVLNLSRFGVCVLTAVLVGIFIFAEDLKNAFGIIFIVMYAIVDVVVAETPWITYLLCICIGAVCVIARLIADFIQAKKGKKFKKGKMFWVLVIAGVGYALAGIIGNFNILSFAVVLALVLLTLALYFIAINHTKNLREGLYFSFILEALYICGLIVVYYLKGGNILYKITVKAIEFVAANGVHSATISIVLGMIGFAALGKGKERDYLYYLGSMALFFFSMITFCRIVMLISVGIFIALTLTMIRASENRKRIITIAIVGIILAASIIIASIIIAVVKGVNLFAYLFEKIEKHFLSGRDVIWTWGLEHFLEYPLFGVGFITRETVHASLRTTLLEYNAVSIHNTLFQWLTSLGIIGTFAVMPFFYKKYFIVLEKDGKEKSFIFLTLLFIALTGLMDSNALLDYFIYLMTVLLVVSAENAPVKAEKETEKSNS